MNRFKTLDNIFPCGKDRLFGEVVSVSISCVYDGMMVTSYYWKRKSAHVNASVNAFHMHRGLCREFSNENKWTRGSQVRAIKRAFGDIVQKAYEWNAETGRQYQSFALDLEDGFWVPLDDLSLDAVDILRSSRKLLNTWDLVPFDFAAPVDLPTSD